MKKTLLATVAIAAVVGFASLAAAQAPAGGEAGKGAAPAAAAQEQKANPGGTVTHQPLGGQPAHKSINPTGQSAQGAPGTTPDATPGAHAPDARMGEGGTPRGANETDKSGAGVNGQNAGNAPASRGANVQLSQDQRSKIMATIGKGSSARATTNIRFNISVGARVPRDVHIAVLPEDVVEIVPQYEGFDYVMVGDEILIIDPNSLDIIAVIEA